MQTSNFGRDELVTLALRELYETRGFRRVKPGKFEEYELYIENKNFLDTDSIITFMDVDGKLLAHKPDVTLSIVKNIPRGAMPASQKVYYTDEVYRLSRENREYKVLGQIGVELIDGDDPLTSLEIIDLALESLGAIGERFVLDISHLGFVSGLLAQAGLSHRKEAAILANIHAKNTADAVRLLRQEGVSAEITERIAALTGIHGSFSEALGRAKELVRGEEMQAAYDDLAMVESLLDSHPYGDNVNLDFSAVNNLDYYNGLIFRGYVEGVPSLVLTGGRYDNLMKRMGKKSGAIGFAVSLDALATYLPSDKQHDFDLLIRYPARCDFPALLAQVKALCAQGKRVRLERDDSDLAAAELTAGRCLAYRDGKLCEEVPGC